MGLTPSKPYHQPEVEQPWVGWAERVPEALGPAGKEGASWVEVEEVEAKEVLLEDHASSVTSDHLVFAEYVEQKPVSSWEEEDVLEELVPQRLVVEVQQKLQLWLLMSAGPVCRCWFL